MDLVVRAFPVLSGKEAEMRQFAHDLQTTRRGEAVSFYSSLGIGHESWHVQAHPKASGSSSSPSSPRKAPPPRPTSTPARTTGLRAGSRSGCGA